MRVHEPNNITPTRWEGPRSVDRDGGEEWQDDDRLLLDNRTVIVDGIFGCATPRQVEASVCFARYLLFLRFLETNNVLQAVLGIIEYCSHNADDGYRIYRLRIADLNNAGKFLDEARDQFEPSSAQLLGLLDRITRIGSFENSLRKSILARHAFEIRIAYSDSRKRCLDVIPQLLMIRLERQGERWMPSQAFQQFLERNSPYGTMPAPRQPRLGGGGRGHEPNGLPLGPAGGEAQRIGGPPTKAGVARVAPARRAPPRSLARKCVNMSARREILP